MLTAYLFLSVIALALLVEAIDEETALSPEALLTTQTPPERGLALRLRVRDRNVPLGYPAWVCAELHNIGSGAITIHKPSLFGYLFLQNRKSRSLPAYRFRFDMDSFEFVRLEPGDYFGWNTWTNDSESDVGHWVFNYEYPPSGKDAAPNVWVGKIGASSVPVRVTRWHAKAILDAVREFLRAKPAAPAPTIRLPAVLLVGSPFTVSMGKAGVRKMLGGPVPEPPTVSIRAARSRVRAGDDIVIYAELRNNYNHPIGVDASGLEGALSFQNAAPSARGDAVSQPLSLLLNRPPADQAAGDSVLLLPDELYGRRYTWKAPAPGVVSVTFGYRNTRIPSRGIVELWQGQTSPAARLSVQVTR